MHFIKMHGLGNDYVYVDADREPIEDAPALSRRVSMPHTGIGSDGLVLFGRSDQADFFMRIYNADGSQAEMCGNASRCIGRFLYERGYTDKTEIILDTLAGPKVLRLRVTEGRVRAVSVDMGELGLTTQAVGMKGAFPEGGTVRLEAEGETFAFTPVSTGNPHIVAFVPDVEAIDLSRLGPAFEHHPDFPARTNVEFAQVLSPTHLRVRVWERGSGATQACGTAACASWVAGVLREKVERRGKVSLPGGDLEICWEKESGHIYQEGTANIVFEGEWLDD